MKFPSKKECDEKSNFALLLADDYEFVIAEIKEEVQDKYMAKPDPKTGVKPQEEVLKVILDVVCFKDGAEAADAEGGDARGRKIFFNGRPGSMGWTQDDLPAKTRCFLAYATEQDINEELEVGDWQELVGKTIYGEIIQGTNQKGRTVNKLARFITPPRKRDVSEVVKKEDIPTVNEEEANNQIAEAKAENVEPEQEPEPDIQEKI